MDHVHYYAREVPEVKTLTLFVGFFCFSSLALFFVFKIMGKGKQLIWMMFRTIVETALVIVTIFLSLLCLGVLLKEFMDSGFQGMFPNVIALYKQYVTVPFLYSWSTSINEVWSALSSLNVSLALFQ